MSKHTPPPIDREPRRMVYIATAAIALAGGALRLIVATDDPWLDEVWTLSLLPQMLHASDVLFHLPYANNHPLNTLYLYWLGDIGDRFWLLRLHSVAAGTLAVGLAGYAVARHGVLAAVLASALTALSVPLVHYSAEARGYSLMLASGWVAFLALRAALEGFAWRPVLGFGAACAVGFTANLYFVQAYSALGLWSAYWLWRERILWGRKVAELVALHAIPLAVFVFLYVAFYLPGLSGDRLPTDWGEVVLWAGSLAVGGPDDGLLAVVAFGAALLLGGFGVSAMRRAGDPVWIFFLLVLLIVPIGWLIVSEKTGLLPRYFAIQILLLPAAVAVGLASAIQLGGLRRIVAGVALAVLTASFAAGDIDLLRKGRGQYGAALRYVVEASPPGETITVGCSHELSGRLLVPYYARFIDDREVRFVPLDAPGPPPLWVMVLSDSDRLVKRGGYLYTREASFESSRFGFPWHAYRIVSGEITPERLQRLRPGAD